MNKISICIATYNGEKYISEQISSIIPQLKKEDEIIVSDDHSKDNTLQILRDFNDSRIKIFMNDGLRGYSKNFENAIDKAKGDVLFICDQDDVWEQNKVEIMMEALQRFDIVVSDALICDSNLNETLGSHFKLHCVSGGFIKNWLKTRYIGACMAFKKEILTRVLPFPSQEKYCAYDYWITLVGEMYYKVGLIDERLIKYRRHGENASTGGIKSNFSRSRQIYTRAYSLYHVLTRM